MYVARLYIAKILPSVRMDYDNLTCVDPFPCKHTLQQTISLCTEEGMATQL